MKAARAAAGASCTTDRVGEGGMWRWKSTAATRAWDRQRHCAIHDKNARGAWTRPASLHRTFAISPLQSGAPLRFGAC